MRLLPKGRFAPSPTGRMHLGNLWAALLSWLSIKSAGGHWVLRIENLDRERSRHQFAELIEDDLHWLGLEADEGGLADKGDSAPYSQNRRDHIYSKALEKIIQTGRVYECRCSRADILVSSAPHQSDGRVVYSGKCRPSFPHFPKFEADTALRLYVPDANISFADAVAGKVSFNLARQCGDFILKRRDGGWAYQLAVVADDIDMGITEIVRGNDLLLSAAQQIYLYKLLGTPPPQMAHIPLLCNVCGQRLSKRDKSLDCSSLRMHFKPERIIGHLAYLAGLVAPGENISASELLQETKRNKTDFLQNLEMTHINVNFADIRTK